MDDVIQEYEDALVTMQLAVACENLRTKETKSMAKPNQVLKLCVKELLRRLKADSVQRVAKGIAMQSQPIAGLTKTVREYNAIKSKIKRDGYAVIKMKDSDEG